PRVSTQSEYEFVSIDELVPDNHLLRLIDKYIDLSFLLEKVRPYYSEILPLTESVSFIRAKTSGLTFWASTEVKCYVC
ncbi:hypothetical protein J7E66_17250, partial [Bacillus sp. ISL-7]|nr:hypothetical protein [Bacillus sp. ISL-7]